MRNEAKSILLKATITLSLICLLAASFAWCQEVTAAITGKVTDPSGAAIANAKVTATDVDRGTAWPTVTNAEGVYDLPRVPVGTYNIKIEAAGFQAAVQ